MIEVPFRADPEYPLEPSRLPPSWSVVALGDVVGDLHPGFSSGVHTEPNAGIPHLRPMNIDRQGHITLEKLLYVRPEGDLRATRGDVLFNNTNSAELVGKTAPLDLDGEWAFSNHMTRLRPPAGLSPRFLAYQLHYLWEAGYFRLRRTQHVNQASISARTLARTVPLVLAPEREQLRIVAELAYNFERVDAAATVLASTLDRLGDYRRGVLRRAAAGTLVPTEAALAQTDGREYVSGAALLERLLVADRERWEAVERTRQEGSRTPPMSERRQARSHPNGKPDVDGLAALPTGWVWARVWQVGEVTLGRQRAPRYHHGPHMRPYLRVANVYEDRIDASDVHEMNFSPAEYEVYALRRGDILLNEGQSPELVGRPAMFNDEVPGACFQKTLLRFRAHPGVSPSFALLVFRDYLHAGRFRQLAKWSTNIAHLGADRFANMEFPLPPLVEQERIVTEAKRCLEAANALTAIVEQVRDRIGRIRHVALERAFSGELVPQDEDDEPTTALLERIARASRAARAIKPTRRRIPNAAEESMEGSRQRRPLVRVLAEGDARLTPEQLLDASGIGEDLIDDFYAELKRDEAAGRITQVRDGDQAFLTLAEGLS